MMTETGRVVAIEPDCLWVETIQRSTCNSCAAESGCGQGLIARWGGQTSRLRVIVDAGDKTDYRIDDEVCLAIHEGLVVSGSLFVYLVPLLLMIVGSGLGHGGWGTEIAATLGGVGGFIMGALLVRWRAWVTRFDARLQVVLKGKISSAVQAINLIEVKG